MFIVVFFLKILLFLATHFYADDWDGRNKDFFKLIFELSYCSIKGFKLKKKKIKFGNRLFFFFFLERRRERDGSQKTAREIKLTTRKYHRICKTKTTELINVGDIDIFTVEKKKKKQKVWNSKVFFFKNCKDCLITDMNKYLSERYFNSWRCDQFEKTIPTKFFSYIQINMIFFVVI